MEERGNLDFFPDSLLGEQRQCDIRQSVNSEAPDNAVAGFIEAGSEQSRRASPCQAPDTVINQSIGKPPGRHQGGEQKRIAPNQEAKPQPPCSAHKVATTPDNSPDEG